MGMGVVDGEGAGNDPGDGHGVQPVNHAARLEDGEVAALPGERRRDAGHATGFPREPAQARQRCVSTLLPDGLQAAREPSPAP